MKNPSLIDAICDRRLEIGGEWEDVVAYGSVSTTQRVATMAKILVVDSGAGGLTIAWQIHALIPCDITFVADELHFPYGDKNPETLAQLVIALVSAALAVCQEVDAVVIACNTASTRALHEVRAAFPFPIIGVVPAIKPAGALSKTGVIGVLATPNTVASCYLEQLRRDHIPNIQVLSYASKDLVSMAEQQLSTGVVCKDSAVLGALKPLFECEDAREIDVLVLACTHFPLLTTQIKRALESISSRQIQVIDSGEAVARQVQRVLQAQGKCGGTNQLQVLSQRRGANGAIMLLEKNYGVVE